MAKKKPRVMLTLEQQLEAMPPCPTFPDIVEPWMGEHVQPTIKAMIDWDQRRADLRDAIRRRDAKRIRDDGKDAGGNFDVSPYVARFHKVEVAPKTIGKELPKDSQFPKRITTQRVADRLRARGTITQVEWRAANTLWEWWSASETGDRLTAAYSPVTVRSSTNTDHLVEKRMEAATHYLELVDLIPYRCRGVVVHVVIRDWELTDWGKDRGFSPSHSARRGGRLLSQGLSALAASLGY